jgi:hypothetical protein
MADRATTERFHASLSNEADPPPLFLPARAGPRSVGTAQPSASDLKHPRIKFGDRAPCSPVRDLGFSMHWPPNPVPLSLQSGSPFIRRPPTTIAPFPSPKSISPGACGAISIASSRLPPPDLSLMAISLPFALRRRCQSRACSRSGKKFALPARAPHLILRLRPFDLLRLCHGISSPLAGLAPDATL